MSMAVYNRWTGTVDWTSGLDYWTHRFVSKAHWTAPETYWEAQQQTLTELKVRVSAEQSPSSRDDPLPHTLAASRLCTMSSSLVPRPHLETICHHAWLPHPPPVSHAVSSTNSSVSRLKKATTWYCSIKGRCATIMRQNVHSINVS